MDLNEEVQLEEEKATPRKNSKKVFVTDELVESKEEKDSKDSTPPKVRAKKTVKKKEVNKDALAKQIFGFHMIAAQFLKSQIWVIEEKEAVQLAESITQMSEQYEFNFDPKIAASINLLATAAMIYGPRLFMYRKQLALMEKQKNDSQESKG